MSSTDMTRLALLRLRQKQAAKLPSEDEGGKPGYDADFKAGFAVGKAAYAKNDQVSKTDADKAYKRVSKKHGSWWVDGYTAAIDLARGATATKPAQIAKKMKLAGTPSPADFKRTVEKALDLLRDARDMAEARGAGYGADSGSLADNDRRIATVVEMIVDFSGKTSAPLSRIR